MDGSDDADDSDGIINIRDQASISMAGTLLDAAISFGGLILFANVLGANGLGKFYVLLAVVQVLLFPVQGVGQSVMKRGSERGHDPAEFLGGGLVYAACYAALVGAGVVTALVVVPSLLRYDATALAAAFSVLGSRIIFLLLLDAYRSHGQTGFATLTDNALGILETAVQSALVLLGHGVVGLLAGTTLATVTVSAALLAVTGITVGRPSRDTLGSIWEFARWSVVTSGLGTVYDRIPVLVAGFVLGNTVAGYYTSAMRLLMLGSYVGGAIAPALMVRASSTMATAGREKRLVDLRLSMQYASVLAVPLMFGSFALPRALMVTIFGSTFVGAGSVLIGLSLYHVANTYDTVTYSFFDGINRPDYTTKATAVSLAVRAVAIGALLAEFGVMGIVAAVVVSHAFHLAYAQVFLADEFGRPVVPTGVAYQFASGLLMWGVVEAVARFVPIVSWAHLVVVVGVGALCYGVGLSATDAQFRQISGAILSEARTKVRNSTL